MILRLGTLVQVLLYSCSLDSGNFLKNIFISKSPVLDVTVKSGEIQRIDVADITLSTVICTLLFLFLLHSSHTSHQGRSTKTLGHVHMQS